MRARQTTLLIVGLVIAAGLVALLVSILRAKDDRPPIIVKGGSIHFEGCADKDGNRKAWKKRQNGHWRPDHKKGRDISKFHVEIVTNNAGSCGAPVVQQDCGNGTLVQTHYSPPTSTGVAGRFEFNAELDDDLGRWEPTLSSDVALQPNGDFDLGFGGEGGTITAAVDGRPCNLASGTALRVTPIP